MAPSEWTVNDIGNQKGRTALITGANSGIGLEAARGLAGAGAMVILTARDSAKGNGALEDIRSTHPDAQLEVEELDLANLTSIRRCTERVRERHKSLDLLINNAGVMMPPLSYTADDFELQFGTNHLGHFALTAQLFDLVANARDSRVVTISSLIHRSGQLDFNDMHWRQRAYKTSQAYADSKLANLFFALELGRRLEDAGYSTLSTAAHPGFSGTNLQRHLPAIGKLITKVVTQSSAMGALPTLRAAVDPEATNGDYFGPAGFLKTRGYPRVEQPAPRALDREAATRLWSESEALTGLAFRVG